MARDSYHREWYVDYKPQLDGVRGMCISAVFLAHAGFLDCGWIGVQVFFVLSGYLITGILLSTRSVAPSWQSYFGLFYARRSLRIFPVYLAYLGVAFLGEKLHLLPFMSIAVPHASANAPYLLTYTYNLHRTVDMSSERSVYFAHLWSLSIEEQFYLIWPLVVFLLDRRMFLALCLGLVLAGPLVRLGELLATWTSGPYARYLGGRFIYFFTLSHLDAFAAGALLNFTNDSRIVRKALAQLSRWIVPTVAAVGAWMLFLAHVAKYHYNLTTFGWPAYLPFFWASVWGYSALNLLGVVIVAGFAAKHLTQIGWLQRLGRVSYGFYVFHLPTLWLVTFAAGATLGETKWINAVDALIALAITWTLAEVSFRWLETPFLKLKPRYRASRITHEPMLESAR